MIRRYVRFLLAFSLVVGSASGLDALDWQTLHPRSGGNSLWGLIGLENGQFLAVGEGGAVVRSLAGDALVVRYSGSDAPLRGLARSRGLLVAVGGDGTILSSIDGAMWTPRNSTTESDLLSVAWAPRRFVAVGRHGVILSSDDGDVWQSEDAGTEHDLLEVTEHRSRFLAVSGGGEVLTSNAPGLPWVGRQVSPYALRAIASNGQEVVAVGGVGSIFRSTDGEAWENRSFPVGYELQDIAWTGRFFVAAGNGVSLSSPDGREWTLISEEAQGVRELAWVGGRLVGVGFGGFIAVSSDGSDWTRLSSRDAISFDDLIWNGGHWLGLTTTPRDRLARSEDGKIWSFEELPDPLSRRARSLARGAEGYVAVGHDGLVMKSIDSVQWQVVASPTSSDLLSVGVGPAGWVAVGFDVALHSPDGSTWTVVPGFPLGLFRDVAWTGSEFVAVGPAIYASSDGMSWHLAKGLLPGEHLSSITSNSDRALAVGKGIYMKVSGGDWTEIETDPDTPNLRKVIWEEDRFLSVGTDGAILSSPDGTSWTRLASGSGAVLDQIAGNAGHLLAAGAGSILRRLPDGEPCLDSTEVLCLSDARFRLEGTWRDFAGRSGAGHAVSVSNDSGYFWFFQPGNLELTVKTLDGRSLNDAFWVFYGALSNVEFGLLVRDTESGQNNLYFNPSGNFASVGDTTAFPSD